MIELVSQGQTVEQQREYPVHYRGHFVGKLVPDLIVNGTIIVDPKVVSAFNESHVALLDVGLSGISPVLKWRCSSIFKESKLTWKHVVVGRTRRRGRQEGARITRITRMGNEMKGGSLCLVSSAGNGEGPHFSHSHPPPSAR